MSARERVPQQPRRPDVPSPEGLVVLPGTGTAAAGPTDRQPGGLAVHGTVDDHDSPVDVLDMMALDPFVSGREPFARTTYLEHVVPDAPLRPAGGRLVREAVTDACVARMYLGDGWTLLATHWRQSRRAQLAATAVSPELAEQVVSGAGAAAVQKPPPAPERVPVGFWHLTAHGPGRVERDIDADTWPEIRDNYTARAAAAVDVLVGQTAATIKGRLMLLHGPPGTGKTTLLRTLARHWRSWCQVDYVLDPELLFGNPSYLLQVALGAAQGAVDDEAADDEEAPQGADGGSGGRERWRLMLLEDCDELIRAEAKSNAGQALSRLLNLTDGLLGQGRKVLVAITTNEDLARLHPAVTRPGRSLAHLEVGRLTPAEAQVWLGDVRPTEAMLRDGATLAELYALRSGEPAVAVLGDAQGYGCYL